MEEFVKKIIETGMNYIPNFEMKEIVILAVSLLLCLLFAMFGYRLLRLFVVLCAFVLGAFAGLSIADILKVDDTFRLILMLVLAVLLALISSVIYKIGIFFTVAFPIFAAAMEVLPEFVPKEYLVPAALAAALLLGIFAVFFSRPIVIVVSALAGGILFSDTLAEFVLTKVKALDPSGVTSAIILVFGGLIAVFGIYWQFTHTKKE